MRARPAIVLAVALAAAGCASHTDAPREATVSAGPTATADEWKVRGWNAIHRGDHAAAVVAFERSLDANFDGSNAATLVREIALAGDPDGAIERAKRLASRVKGTYLALVEDAAGDVEILRGDRDAALAAYRRAEAADPHC
jgi:hypothetical protein